MDTVHFSHWAHWNERTRLPERDAPGVYILGRFESSPPERIDPTDERVLLIAETHGQTLAQRWYQFDRAATSGADGHAGGYTFWRLFGDGRLSQIPGWLYVAAAEVPSGLNDVKGYVQALKMRLLEHYRDRHGILPCCNIRGPAPVQRSVVSEVPIRASDSGSSVESGGGQPHEPVVRFSQWLAWSERKRIEGRHAPGVYALARFDSEPPPVPDVLDGSVIYLGETCDNSLHGRLAQFNRSAFLGKDGHSGGWTYRSRYADQGQQLYVCAFPVTQLVEPHRSAFIRYVERQLLWRYVLRWGRRPACNSK